MKKKCFKLLCQFQFAIIIISFNTLLFMTIVKITNFLNKKTGILLQPEQKKKKDYP